MPTQAYRLVPVHLVHYAHRGDVIDDQGTEGLFVGRTPVGTDWIVWGCDPQRFDRMSRQFDKRYGHTS